MPGSREATRVALFDNRLARWRADLDAGLQRLYRPDEAAALSDRLVALAASCVDERPGDLLELDAWREQHSDWFQRPSMVGYAAYADRFAGDLAGVTDRIGYLRELGVTYLHLMPLLRSRDGEDDGGYAVSDYTAVRPDLGTIDDLAELAGQLRAAGISLVVDLVCNHVAREHPWAVAARAGDPDHRAFFHVFADRAVPDQYERTLPEVFPEWAPGNFTWDDDLDGWVWTTFNAYQWDLDWSNPEVFRAFAEIILTLANVGVEVFRLDAVAFLWKRVGTDCQNQPEVHAITQALRALVRIAAPAVVFKAEAIVGPAQLVQYLGTGPYAGKVCDLAYHNSLMVQIWSMLASRNTRLAAHTLGALTRKPSTAAWITYVRCHDDIGWAIDDADAAAVGLDGAAHRHFLSDYYAGAFVGSHADGLVFQRNEHTGDRRISGTAASLAALAAGEARVDVAVARILLAHAVAFGWGGIPVIWMGDEIGQLNDVAWAAEPGHARDNRWAHRPRMDWRLASLRTDPATTAGRIFAGLSTLARVRATLPQLHASIETEVLDSGDDGVLALRRPHHDGDLLGLYNVTEHARACPAGLLRAAGFDAAVDLLADEHLPADVAVALGPYQARWVVAANRPVP